MEHVRHLFMLLALASMIGCSQSERSDVASANGAKAVSLQMRLVADSSSAECEQMTLTTNRNDGSRLEVIFVQKAVLLDETDVGKARVWVRGDIVGLDISLTDTGSNRLAEITRHNIGKRVAILVDDKLRAAPPILSEVTLGEFDFSSNWSVEEARKICDRLGQAAKRGK